jgi:murein peptide amidase A
MTERASRFDRDVEPMMAALPPASVEVLAMVHRPARSWPVYCVRPAALDPSRRTVLISAGVHGDECAGVYAALRFLERERHEFDRHFQFVVLPCINPSGFDDQTLATASGANLNRIFGLESEQVEVHAVEAWLRAHQPRFAITFDLHEVRPDYVGEGYTEKDNPRGAYLYELVSDNSPRFGRAMIDALPAHRAVCRWPTIYDDINDRGVVSYPQGNRNAVYARGTAFDSFLNSRYTSHSFTLETPTGWPLEERVDTHLSWISTALRLSSAG